MLRKLDLSENEISSCEGFEGHSTLQYLIFRQNKLKNLKGLKNCP
jgi:Leucine-rich repeat (LRR) protein